MSTTSFSIKPNEDLRWCSIQLEVEGNVHNRLEVQHLTADGGRMLQQLRTVV